MFFIGEKKLAEAVDLTSHEEIDQRARESDFGSEGGGEFFDRREGGKLAHGDGRNMARDHSRVKWQYELIRSSGCLRLRRQFYVF